VEVESFELGILNQNIIGERSFDALLFGELTPRPESLYAFWHSRERNYPGLNITGYTNKKVDDALETVLSSSDAEKRVMALGIISEEIKKDIPAVFLYRPTNIYATGSKFAQIYAEQKSSERFMDAYKWYVKTDRVWQIFAKNNQ